MSTALRKVWTQAQFLDWAETQAQRYEFDGIRPVAMTGGTNGASAIVTNLIATLHTRLRGSGCRPLGPDAGVETVNKAIRYPDAIVTCSRFSLSDRTVPGVVVIFEVLGRTPEAERRDRIVKVREYAAIPSVRRYVIAESAGIGLTVLERRGPEEAWRLSVLGEGEILRLPEIGIEIPIGEIYEDIIFPDGDAPPA
jgi:Uma2 family endonuclease